MNLKGADFAARPASLPLPPDWHFGTLWEVMQRSSFCTFCKLISDSASDLVYKREVEVLGCWTPDVHYEVSGEDGSQTEMCTLLLRILPEMVGWENAFDAFDVVPIGRHDVGSEGTMFLGRKVNRDFIDVELIKTWLHKCQEWHDVVCWPQAAHLHHHVAIAASKSFFNTLIRLIDVEGSCLVELDSPSHYVALSYVWGTKPVFRTLKDSIDKLKEAGSLTELFETLPRTIQDAITLTKLVGYRYLWVDSLCIIQDDEADKNVQLGHMDAIYTRASFSIVAASGEDATAGLPGVPCGGPGRGVIQRTAKYSADLELLALWPSCDDAIQTSKWNSRGWTYQERLLSRRLLVFTKDAVFFQCGQAVWSEDFNMLSPDVSMSASRTTITHSRGESPPILEPRIPYRLGVQPERYLQMVAEYTLRDMTYASDRVRGFQGILSVLENAGNRIVWGMWVNDMLIQALLWQPREELIRIPPRNGGKNGENSPQYPSWSWAGWIGAVKYDPVDDWNGLAPLSSFEDRARTSQFGESVEISKDDPRFLVVNTRVAEFRLTLHDRSGALRPPTLPDVRGRHVVRFGLTSKHSGSDEWLGTILLPRSFRMELGIEYEFAVLSAAYGFASDELSAAASTSLGPWQVVNVLMFVRHVPRAADTILPSTGPSTTIVERVGVGKMLLAGWNDAQQHSEVFLLA